MFPSIKNFDMWWKTHSGTMDSRVASIGGSEPEFNSLMFEKKLSSLKDSQESINSCSAWCLENRKHHKKIVMAWLNVLRRVKVEHRLTLFYLANDVIQYSKRKNYDFVESWGTTLQKATTMVREEKVKHKILRIFQIWEQRGVYSEEFIADLSGLISAAPTKKDDLTEFQSSYCITKIRSCASLEKDTDSKLNKLKEHHPKSIEDLQHFIKDRSHVHDVEQEVEDRIKHIESYVKALQAEIKARAHLITVLTQAEKHYEVERKEVKVVVNAYRTFGTKVKAVKKRLDEIKPTLHSPVPSPDINAPSPGPDSDIELPSNDNNGSFAVSDQMYSNPGFYNSLTQTESNNFATNGFSSFLGSSLPFNMQNFDSTSLFSDPSNVGYDPSSLFKSAPPPPPVAPPAVTPVPVPGVFDYAASQQSPLMPPPLPPFTTNSYLESTTSYTNSTFSGANTYANASSYQQSIQNDNMFMVASQEQSTYQRHPDEYNPEEELETWENTEVWEVPGVDTPESPPTYEKESFAEPIEYDETKLLQNQGGDIDQRILLPPLDVSLDGSEQSHRAKDVDHRNLISLTGSPGLEGRSPGLPPPALSTVWSTQGDQDYRNPVNCDSDQDYRVPFNIDHENIPLPQKADSNCTIPSSPKADNVESIDMELSDDEDNLPIKCSPEKFSAQYSEDNNFRQNMVLNNNLTLNSIGTQKIETLVGSSHLPGTGTLLEPPPPIPQNLCEMPDIDADANDFLDTLDHDLNNDDFLPVTELLSTDVEAVNKFSARNRPPIPTHALLSVAPGLLPHPEFGKGWNQSIEEWNEANFTSEKRRNAERGSFRPRGNGNYFEVPPAPPSDHFDDHRFRGRGGRGFRGIRRGGIRGPNPRSFIRGGRGKYRGGFRGGF